MLESSLARVLYNVTVSIPFAYFQRQIFQNPANHEIFSPELETLPLSFFLNRLLLVRYRTTPCRFSRIVHVREESIPKELYGIRGRVGSFQSECALRCKVGNNAVAENMSVFGC